MPPKGWRKQTDGSEAVASDSDVAVADGQLYRVELRGYYVGDHMAACEAGAISEAMKTGRCPNAPAISFSVKPVN